MDALANLGIDLQGIIFHLVNFGVVLFVLWKWVYTPLLKTIDERRNTIETNINEAEHLRKNFEDTIAKQKQENEAYIAEQRGKIAEAQKFAKQSAKELIADADARREAMLAEAQQQIEQLQSDMVHGAESEMKDRIKAIVLHVLQNTVPEKTVQKSVDDAVAAVTK